MNGFELISQDIDQERLRKEGPQLYAVKNFFAVLRCRQKELARENKNCEKIDEIIKAESRNIRILLAEIWQLDLSADEARRLMAHFTRQILSYT